MTAPMIHTLRVNFQSQALIMNGVIMGVKGFLSFLSAPLIGSLSDVCGRKMFLLLTALFTCIPIPFLLLDATVYFVALALSGIFSIIFSVAFAYVSDVTSESDRSLGYGLVTAGFAASLIISPALGAGIEMLTGSENIVIISASLVGLVDVVYITLCIPESLTNSGKLKFKSLTFKQVDPFASLHHIWKDKTVLVISLVTFLSYLSEAGQSSCFFVYLTLVLGMSKINVALFICYVGTVSVISQTFLLSSLIKRIGAKYSIIIGLLAQLAQLVCYGVTSHHIAVWTAGLGIAVSSITYAAISSYASVITDKDKQGAVQGTLMGVRGLCNGLGPAAFGLMFHLFGIDIINDGNDKDIAVTNSTSDIHLGSNFIMEQFETNFILNQDEVIQLNEDSPFKDIVTQMPGLPFLIVSFCVLLALACSVFLQNINIDYNDNQECSKKDELENSQNSNSDVPLAKEESPKGGETD